MAPKMKAGSTKLFQLTSTLSDTDLPSLTFSSTPSPTRTPMPTSTKSFTDHTDTFSIKTLSTVSSASSKMYWRRRQNCCTNFYIIVMTMLRRHARRRRMKHTSSTDLAPKSRLTQSVGGDFVYTNAYEVILPTPRGSPTSLSGRRSDTYIVRSESLPPPPLPQRNSPQSSDSITPQPRPDIGISRLNSPEEGFRPVNSTTPTGTPTKLPPNFSRSSTPSRKQRPESRASPSPSPSSDSILVSKWPDKYRHALFSNSHFEPLIEEDDVQNNSNSSSPTNKDEVISVQIHRETSATPKKSGPEIPPKPGRPPSRSGSKLSHISILSGSRIVPVFEDRGSKLSGTISINSRLFADDQIRSSFRSVSQNSSRYYSDYRMSGTDRKSPPEQPDVFRNDKNLSRKNSDVDDSLILETDYYVRQMKQRRNQVS